MYAQAWATLSFLRFSYAMRTVGIGSERHDRGRRRAYRARKRQIDRQCRPLRIWRRRISANESGSDTQQFGRMDLPPPNTPLRFDDEPRSRVRLQHRTLGIHGSIRPVLARQAYKGSWKAMQRQCRPVGAAVSLIRCHTSLVAGGHHAQSAPHSAAHASGDREVRQIQ